MYLIRFRFQKWDRRETLSTELDKKQGTDYSKIDGLILCDTWDLLHQFIFMGAGFCFRSTMPIYRTLFSLIFNTVSFHFFFQVRWRSNTYTNVPRIIIYYHCFERSEWIRASTRRNLNQLVPTRALNQNKDKIMLTKTIAFKATYTYIVDLQNYSQTHSTKPLWTIDERLGAARVGTFDKNLWVINDQTAQLSPNQAV